jgi:predicted AAA+ superfamily ATPase
LRSTERAAEIIRQNTERHGAAVGKAQHILVHGDEGSGKRWLFRSVLGSMIRSGQTNVRVVLLSRAELRNLTQLCDRMKNEPRVRFVVLLELPLALAPHAEFYNTLTSALDGGGTIWPPNAVMYATAPCDSCLKPESHEGGSRGLSDAFGIKLDLHSNPEKFVADARDLAQRQGVEIDDSKALQFLGEAKPSVALAQSFIDSVCGTT